MYSILIIEKNHSNWFTATVDGKQIYDAGGYAPCTNVFAALPLPNPLKNEINFRMGPNAGAGFGHWKISFKLVGEHGDISPIFDHSGIDYQIGAMLFVVDKSAPDWKNYCTNHFLLWKYENPTLSDIDYPGCNISSNEDLKGLI
ncbi:hypothetical protein [Fluviicola taffensis]|uniref:hypothetical protein n=1 Tax=Fluviicola taffensis TaxID=191579 RepID=UPI003138104E